MPFLQVEMSPTRSFEENSEDRLHTDQLNLTLEASPEEPLRSMSIMESSTSSTFTNIGSKLEQNLFKEIEASSRSKSPFNQGHLNLIISKSPSEKAKKIRKSKGSVEIDSLAPKRPKTAYRLWMSQSKAELNQAISSEHGTSVGEFSKLAAEKWKLLSYEEKSKWHEKANEEKMRYSLGMEEYQRTKTIESD